MWACECVSGVGRGGGGYRGICAMVHDIVCTLLGGVTKKLMYVNYY